MTCSLISVYENVFHIIGGILTQLFRGYMLMFDIALIYLWKDLETMGFKGSKKNHPCEEDEVALSEGK